MNLTNDKAPLCLEGFYFVYNSWPVSLITNTPLKSQLRISAIWFNSFSLKLSRFSLLDKLLWEVPRLAANSVIVIFRFTNAIDI